MNSESGDIVFSGTDGLTCHQFIRAVRERAIEAGHQRNDEWMADYASVRFEGEALKWFESLDDQTQINWKLLRRSILLHYEEPAYEESTAATSAKGQRSVFTFTGKDKNECREFVREIRLRASEQGKDNDLGWMIEIASPCFAGDALEWHTSLPVAVQTSWRHLERAILVDYPFPSSTTVSPARIQVKNWFTTVAPSPSMRAIRSREDWLAQAKERQRMYQQANNQSTPCWLLIEQGDHIPENALWTGCEKSSKPLFSARAWHEDKGLIVGKCGRHISGAYIPLNGREFGGILPFEVLVGDPSYFYWVAGPDRSAPSGNVKHRPFWGVEAGLELSNRNRATFISQVPCENGRLPGKVHSPGHWAHGCTEGKEVTKETHLGRVLAWVDQ